MSGRAIELCLVTQHFHPTYSGAAHRFRSYGPGLLERGVRMTVFTVAAQSADDGLGSPGSNTPPVQLLPLETVDTIPVQRVRLENTKAITRSRHFIRSFVRYWMDLVEKPDVVQLLSLSPGMLPALPALRKVRAPLVYTHTMVGEMSSIPIKRWLQGVYWPIPLRFVDQIVVNSSTMKDALRSIGVSRHVEVIQNGVNLERFKPVTSLVERAALRKRLGLPDNGRIVLFVGPISARKGLDVLVEAWASVQHRFPDATLILVGPNHDEITRRRTGFQAHLMQTLMQAGAVNSVLFTGRVDHVEEYFRAADAFIFPSRREGMPNVVLEAFASGLPTILTPFLGLPPEFGRPEREYILTERSPSALSAAMERVLSDSAAARTLGQGARRWAEATMDVSTSLDRYAALYHRLAAKPRPETEDNRVMAS